MFRGSRVGGGVGPEPGGLVSLYDEVQCIMGNGHMVPLPVNRQTDTSLAGCKNHIDILTDTPE